MQLPVDTVSGLTGQPVGGLHFNAGAFAAGAHSAGGVLHLGAFGQNGEGGAEALLGMAQQNLLGMAQQNLASLVLAKQMQGASAAFQAASANGSTCFSQPAAYHCQGAASSAMNGSWLANGHGHIAREDGMEDEMEEQDNDSHVSESEQGESQGQPRGKTSNWEDGECTEQNTFGPSSAKQGGSGVKRARRPEQVVLKKAKRGVYTVLKEFIDQDMETPADQRMKGIIKELRKVQRTEKHAGNKEWVGCDECQKWRKVPRGFQFDRAKIFFCSMMPKLSCDTKEEPWEEGEQDATFIDVDWVLLSWGRLKAELVKEKNKFEAAAKLAGIAPRSGSSDDMPAEYQPSPLQGSERCEACLPDPKLHGPRTDGEPCGSAERATANQLESQTGNGDSSEMQSTPAAVEKAGQWVRAQMETLCQWNIDDNVEAKDCSGKWYRASVRGVSYSRRQVKINFGGWDSKWDEWIRVKDRRVRDIQCPEATRIRTDGTPIWPKSKKKEDEIEEMEEMEMEEMEMASAAPAKLTREEQRNLDRLRRLEAEEQRRIKKEKKEQNGPSPYQIFVNEETARLMKEHKDLRVLEAKKMAREEWKKRTGVEPELPMGFVIGSVHQLYACLDEESVLLVAEKLKLDAEKLLNMNKAVYPGMKMNDKLMEGTLLKLPLREGSGDGKREIKVLCKVQAVKNILTFSLKENETIKALKKRVYAKEDIKIKEQTVVYANQRLDDNRTLADYNISDEALVVIQVGHIDAVQTANDLQEIEYDSRWMLSAAGKRFMDTKEGQAWLKTKAGLEWQKQKKQDEREEIKEKMEERREKMREERGEQPGAALKKFNVWFKAEVARLREQHSHMSQKEAAEAARWTWKVYAGPSTYKHRAAFAKFPSVVSWNSHNLNRHADTSSAESESPSSAAEKEGISTTGTGKSRKRRDIDVSEELSSSIKANAFSTSYDWSYRENHLSRTAKKAARISLTTDTIEMMTCELEGLDDRYDGSGWTTWKSKGNVNGQNKAKKFNKDGTERKPRQSRPRQPKEPTDSLAVPKEKSGHLPRWLKGVPRCPDLLLPKDENIHLRPQKSTADEAAEATQEGFQDEMQTADNRSSLTEPDFFGTLSEREKKRQMDVLQKLMAPTAKSESSHADCAEMGQGSSTDACGEQEAMSELHVKVEMAKPESVDNSVKFVEPAKELLEDQVSGVEEKEAPHDSQHASVEVDNTRAQETLLVSVCGEVAGTVTSSGAHETEAEKVSSTDTQQGGAESALARSALLPLPSNAQLASSLEGFGGVSFFKLPYMAARYKFQKEFEDYVCGDKKSEFPTPFVPINKNEYVDGESACRLAVHEGKNICQCIFVPGTPETACGEDSNCLLRDIYIECGERCPCGSNCLNKRFKKRQWAKCSIFLASNGRGWALRNDEPLVTGQMVMEYTGEVISGDEVDLRMSEYAGKRHTYLLKLNNEEFIDSTRKANLARFINHCCEPNCVMQKWNVGGVQRVGLFAKYNIPAGCELTFDYDMEFYGSEDVKCLCGAPQCRGTLGKGKDEGEKCRKGKDVDVGAKGKGTNLSASASKAERAVHKKVTKEAGGGRKDKPRADKHENGRDSLKANGAVGGSKRKQSEEVANGNSDDFFSNMSPRERKRQLAMMQKMMKTQ